MPSKDKNAWKSRKRANPELWKKNKKAYNDRYVLRNKLRKKAEELVFKIQSSYLIKSHGSPDKLMKEIASALKLPYCWTLEDYDHAFARLNKVEEEVRIISKGKKDNANVYHKCLEMLSTLAPDDSQLKLAIAYDMFCKAATEAMSKRVDDREKTDANFVSLLVTRPDGYYPKWFPDNVVDKLNHMLCREDLIKVINGLTKCVNATARVENASKYLEAALAVDDDKNPNEIMT